MKTLLLWKIDTGTDGPVAPAALRASLEKERDYFIKTARLNGPPPSPLISEQAGFEQVAAQIEGGIQAACAVADNLASLGVLRVNATVSGHYAEAASDGVSHRLMVFVDEAAGEPGER